MKKVVINTCWGKFGLSIKAARMFWRLKGYKDVCFYKKDFYTQKYCKLSEEANPSIYVCSRKDYGDVVEKIAVEDLLKSDDICREDLDLVKVIETLGVEANERSANLKIVEIPSDVEYYIDDYDGVESIHENHRIWE